MPGKPDTSDTAESLTFRHCRSAAVPRVDAMRAIRGAVSGKSARWKNRHSRSIIGSRDRLSSRGLGLQATSAPGRCRAASVVAQSLTPRAQSPQASLRASPFPQDRRRLPESRRHPLLEQGIGDGEHHRSDEEPHDAEGNQSADHAGKDQQQRNVGSPLDQQRPDDIVERARDDGDHQERRAPRGAAGPEKPYDGRQHHGQRTQLAEAEEQHHRCQERGGGNSAEEEAEATNGGLDEGGDHHAEHDASDGLRSQHAASCPC